MPGSHKLSIIVFADIAGYTSMMQKNEEQALLLLNRFKEVLESATAASGGQLIQYFGDAGLLSFDNATDAVDCAIAIQKNLSTSPEVPVRIGMHLGDVVFKENNVFGDGVNIASRIESLGIPGAILLSKTVRDQIKNKSDFLLVSLGSFEFKNVDESLEVFALANPGFVIPKREEMKGKLKETIRKKRSKWLVPLLIIGACGIAAGAWFLGKEASGSPLSKEIRERPVAVMSFDNQTMDKNLDAFGLMSMDWISQGLQESGKAHVIKADPLESERNKNKSIPKGAEVLIKGRYYNQENGRIATVAEIVDAKTNTILYSLKPLIGNKDSLMNVLGELQQEIVGYWVLNKELLGKRPPRFDAYQAYLKGLEIGGTDYTKAELYFKEASKLDPEFNSPLFALATIGLNTTRSKLRDSVMAILEKKETDFTEYEKLIWYGFRARVSGDFIKSATLGWELYEKYHIEQGAKTAISHYRANNYLHKSIETYRLFKPVELRPEDSYAGQTVLGEAFESLSNLGLHDSVIAWVNKMNYPVIDVDIALVHLKALVHLNKMNDVKKYIEKYRNMKLAGHSYWVPSLLNWRVCTELYLQDRTKELPEYLDLFQKAVLDDPGSTFYNYHLAIIAFMRGEYSKAYELGIKYYESSPQFNLFTEFPGVCLIKMRKNEKAKEWIQHLVKSGSTYPGQLDYAIGVIKANLGENEEALSYLERSFNSGFDFDFYCFREDFLLKDLFDYKPFMEFTEPK